MNRCSLQLMSLNIIDCLVRVKKLYNIIARVGRGTAAEMVSGHICEPINSRHQVLGKLAEEPCKTPCNSACFPGQHHFDMASILHESASHQIYLVM